jgi:hypothetical protein
LSSVTMGWAVSVAAEADRGVLLTADWISSRLKTEPPPIPPAVKP